MFGRTLAVMIVSAGLISAPLPAQARQPAAADPATEPAGEPEVGPAPQPSGDLERAKELYVNGQQLYGEGSYEAAILAFKEGYQLSKKPEFLYNIANAYERMGEFGQARDYLDQFRAYASNDQQEALARKIASLDKRQREKEANAQQQQDQAAHEAAARERRRQELADQEKKDKVWGPEAWALSTVTLIGLGLGIGFGVRATNQRDRALESCTEDPAMRVCSTEAEAAISAQKQSAIVADVGFVVGAAAGVALITVLAIKATRKKQRAQEAQPTPPATAFTPYVGQTGGGLVWTTRF